jgi:hypothetical protein
MPGPAIQALHHFTFKACVCLKVLMGPSQSVGDRQPGYSETDE